MVNLLIQELKEKGYHKSIKDFDAEIIAKSFARSKMYDDTLPLEKLVEVCLKWWMKYELYV